MQKSKEVSQNLLDIDVPKIDVPLLKPKNVYKANLNKAFNKSKEKVTNLLSKSKEEVLHLFDKYRNNVNKGVKKITNWYNYLKEHVLDIFNKIQGRFDPTTSLSFKLDKEALNVTKRYELDLKKSELTLYDPLTLEKNKTIGFE